MVFMFLNRVFNLLVPDLESEESENFRLFVSGDYLFELVSSKPG